MPQVIETPTVKTLASMPEVARFHLTGNRVNQELRAFSGGSK